MKKCNADISGEKAKGLVAVSIFSVLIGFSVVLTKISLEYTDSFTVLAWRYNLGAIAIIAIVLASKKIRSDFKKTNKDLMLVAITYVGFMGLQTYGLSFATSIEGAILFAIVPILTTIMATILIKETSTKKQNIFMLISAIALIYMVFQGSTGDGGGNLYGISILFVSSLSMSLSNVWMRNVRNVITPFQISFAVCIFGAIILNIIRFCIVGFDNYFTPLLDIEFFLIIAYLGVFCIFGTSVLVSYSLSKITALETTIFGNLSTAISIIGGVVIIGETLNLNQIVATIIIIACIIGVSVSGKKK